MYTNNEREIGDRVRAARKEKGYTQTELGALLQWDQPQISRIECGKDVDSLTKLRLLADALEKPYLYFLEGETVIEYLETKELWKDTCPPENNGPSEERNRK